MCSVFSGTDGGSTFSTVVKNKTGCQMVTGNTVMTQGHHRFKMTSTAAEDVQRSVCFGVVDAAADPSSVHWTVILKKGAPEAHGRIVTGTALNCHNIDDTVPSLDMAGYPDSINTTIEIDVNMDEKKLFFS